VGRKESETESALAICARQLARNLAPYEEPIDVPLANQGWAQGPVSEGNTWAAQGDWEQATRCWSDALASDPGNHAALYNLGVAAEAVGDLAAAQSLYQRAAEIHSDRLYASAIERTVKRMEEIRLAQQPPIMQAGQIR
jgi:tetratricopeptide (TPR) repeat protein